MEVLIKNYALPQEGEQVSITILSDGSVIEHFRNESGRWDSYRSGGLKAIELPSHGDLIDIDLAIEDFAEKHCRYGACKGKACKDCDYYYMIEFFKTSIRKVMEAT